MGGHTATGLTRKTSQGRQAIAPTTVGGFRATAAAMPKAAATAPKLKQESYQTKRRNRIVDIWKTLANNQGSLNGTIAQAIRAGQEKRTQKPMSLEDRLKFTDMGEDPSQWAEHRIGINVDGLRGDLVYFKKITPNAPLEVRHDIGMGIEVDTDTGGNLQAHVFPYNPRANNQHNRRKTLWANKSPRIAATPSNLIINPPDEEITVQTVSEAIDTDTRFRANAIKARRQAIQDDINKNIEMSVKNQLKQGIDADTKLSDNEKNIKKAQIDAGKSDEHYDESVANKVRDAIFAEKEKQIAEVRNDENLGKLERESAKQIIKALLEFKVDGIPLFDKNGSLDTFVRHAIEKPSRPGTNKYQKGIIGQLRPITDATPDLQASVYPLGVPKAKYEAIVQNVKTIYPSLSAKEKKALVDIYARQAGKNSDAVAALTADGSSYDDWNKYSIYIGTVNGRDCEIHFHYNKKTGRVNHTVDLKVKEPNGDFEHIDTLSSNIGVETGGIILSRDGFNIVKQQAKDEIKLEKERLGKKSKRTRQLDMYRVNKLEHELDKA